MCLGEFCDVMRCDVLKSASFLDGEDMKTTDVSVWTPLPKGPSTKYSVTPLQFPKSSSSSSNFDENSSSGSGGNTQSESNSEEPEGQKNSNKEDVGLNTVQEDAHDHEQKKPTTPIQPDGQCDEAYFSKLRDKCSNLVWQCLQGLITVLDVKEFKALQSKQIEISS